jgi:hypothetical protein
MNLKAQIAILAFLSAFVRLPSLNGHFVFDDRLALLKNNDVFNVTEPWLEVFNHDFWGSNLTSNQRSPILIVF